MRNLPALPGKVDAMFRTVFFMNLSWTAHFNRSVLALPQFQFCLAEAIHNRCPTAGSRLVHCFGRTIAQRLVWALVVVEDDVLGQAGVALLVMTWVLITGGLSALGAAMAAGRPLTVLSAFVATPLTTLNPAIGVGMVTSAVELYLRKPNVGDFSRLRTDVASWSGWWRNRVSRILVVFRFSNLGAAIGTEVAGFQLIEKLYYY